MDEQSYNETVKRLKQVNAVIAGLDEEIRYGAFEILRPYIEGKGDPAASVEGNGKGNSGATVLLADTSSAEAFVRSQELGKPAQAAFAIAAWWFGEYGSAPITRANMEAIGNQIGVTLPARPDSTLKNAKKDGKALFRAVRRGAYAPTVPHGEMHLKTEYKVEKGTKAPPTSDE